MFSDGIIRKVSTILGLSPHDAVMEVHGPRAVTFLVVYESKGGFQAEADHDDAGWWEDRGDAIRAAERVYCGCYVGNSWSKP